MVEKLCQILVIEDDPDLPALLKAHMEVSSFQVTIAVDGPSGLALARRGHFDALIVDSNLPGLSGVELIKQLRADGNRVPILMLTSRADELDKVVGLNAGADDYVTKPFALAELLARINALTRRAAMPQTSPATAARVFGDLTIDPQMRSVFLRGATVELTPLEFDLLAFLSASPGRPFDRSQILDAVWGTTVQEYEYSLTSVIARLRRKIEVDPAAPKFVHTIRGIGYRFARFDEL